MLLKRSKSETLKMVWEVRCRERLSHLVGTAHFFPVSFHASLSRLLQPAAVALFEGPLDTQNMSRVIEAGTLADGSHHIFQDLDGATIERLQTVLAPACRNRQSFYVFNPFKKSAVHPVRDMLDGMKPWLAFFTLWSAFLEKSGWRYSVDLEAYGIATAIGTPVAFMETIEEQIRVLENLSFERIISFLKRIDQWPQIARAYAEAYLAGDLAKMRQMGLRFPSRHASVIDHRDERFFACMLPHLTRGRAVVFVGAPHVPGLARMLTAEGCTVSGPPVPESRPQ